MAARRRFGRQVSFWLLGLLLVLLLSAASAPSPLYGVYQGMWQFPAITLTAVYASYALGGLGALLTTGRLPDHLGRRVVLAAGLVVEAAAMLVFVLAGDVTALYLGRILAGVGIGIAAGAVSAWLLDLSPPSDPGLGSVVGGAAPLLGPSLASQLLATDSRAAGDIVIFALAGTGAVTAVAVRSGEPNRLLVRGSALVIVGVSITLMGQFLLSVALLYGGSIVAGVGLGAGFSAYVRATAPLVAPERRSALVAAIYVAVYLSFSVPTILGGAAATIIGLAPTAYGYGAIVIVLAAISTVAVSRRLRDLR